LVASLVYSTDQTENWRKHKNIKRRALKIRKQIIHEGNPEDTGSKTAG